MKARQIQTKAGRWAEDNNIAQNWRKIMNIWMSFYCSSEFWLWARRTESAASTCGCARHLVYGNHTTHLSLGLTSRSAPKRNIGRLFPWRTEHVRVPHDYVGRLSFVLEWKTPCSTWGFVVSPAQYWQCTTTAFQIRKSAEETMQWTKDDWFKIQRRPGLCRYCSS
jgi:hypothetical protein